ncbi:unnamed protein product [Rotaria sp. Silwood2]|nr:unnamed protein product [Rotaria sp. Silwood2]
MGSSNSSEEKRDASILCDPKQGEASELYWACRAGDLDTVKKIFHSTPFVDINRLEPNGSTALHAASFFGHVDVLRFLLHEKNIVQHKRNRYGMTAYEEAPNDQIRVLFHRPADNQRFCTSEDTKKSLIMPLDEISEDIDEPHPNEETETIPDDWVVGSKSDGDMRLEIFLKYMLAVGMTSNANRRFIKLICRLITKTDMYFVFSSLLQSFIDTKITKNGPHYDIASLYVEKYRTTKRIENLLTLYTLECPFYKSLGYGDETALLYMPIIWQLHKLQHRAFTGRSYRGLTMTQKDFRAYQWAEENHERSITIQSFCSTSVVEKVALKFSGVGNGQTSISDRVHVLMAMDFRIACPTAIRLYKISKNTECLSAYEEELEVLVLPGTIFRVTSIEMMNSVYVIYLENILAKWDPDLILKIMTRQNMVNELNEMFQKVLSQTESN